MKTNDVARARAALRAVAWPGVLAGALRRGLRRHAALRRRCAAHGSPRGLHLLRVETRRLLTLSELIGAVCGVATGKLDGALRRCLRATAKARDATVQSAEVDERIAAFPELRPFRAQLRRKAKRRVGDTRGRLRHGGRKLSRSGRAVADLAAASGVGAAAGPAVLRALRAALRAARTANREAHRAAAKTHRARLDLKRLRYMGDAVQGWVPGITAAWLERLRRRQHLSGDLHDVQVLARGLAKYVTEWPGERVRLRRFQRWLAGREARLWQQCRSDVPVPSAGLRALLARREGGAGRAQGRRGAEAKSGARGRRPSGRTSLA